MSIALLIPVFFVALGAICASFAGVVAERLHTGEGWTTNRSKCNSCARVLSLPDLIPVASWVIHGGKCRTCKSRVPYRYALTEVVVAVLFFAGYAAFGVSLSLLFYLISIFLLTVIVLYDLRHTVVPLSFAAALVVSGALFQLVTVSAPEELLPIVILAGSIGLGFFLMHVISQGRWMGLGDAPIAFALSLLVGLQAFTGLLFSFWIGAAIGIAILVVAKPGHRMGIEVPFVPFLAAGYLLALFTQWNPLPL